MGRRQEERPTGCDTLLDVSVGSPAVSVDSIVALADSYSQRMVESLHEAESLEQLRRCLTGSYISFLAEVLALARDE